jgi:hypothetical protein
MIDTYMLASSKPFTPHPSPTASSPPDQTRVLPPDVRRLNAGPLMFERAMTPLQRGRRPSPSDMPPPRRLIIHLSCGFTSSNHQLEAELFDASRHKIGRANVTLSIYMRICRWAKQYTNTMGFSCRPSVNHFLRGDLTEEEMVNALVLAAPNVRPFGFGEDRVPLRHTTHEYRVSTSIRQPLASHTTLSLSRPLPASLMWTKCPATVSKPRGHPSLSQVRTTRTFTPLSVLAAWIL